MTQARLAAVAIVERLRGAGFVAFFAGGCVRDELLGRVPSDYDVATDAVPEQITKLFDRTAEVGAHFGVVLVKVQREVIEVATFRADGTYSDARRPDSVRFSTPDEDARRRDFTVNALFLEPRGGTAGLVGSPAIKQTRAGTVIDYVGGLADLDAKVLRAVGDAHQRLAEDHLRALRAVRLAGKLGFAIEESTAKAITAHASELRGVSRERIGDELRAMMEHPTRARAAEEIARLGMEGPIFRDGLTLAAGARLLATLREAASFGVCLAAWMVDRGLALEVGAIAKAKAGVRDALLLSNKEAADFEHALAGVVAFVGQWEGSGVATRKRLLAGPLAIGREILAGISPEIARRVDADARALAADGIGIEPAMLLTGDVLVSWGYKPGPGFKAVLSQVYDAQLEGRVKNLDDARELALRLGV
ncbi:MAG TPA: CCA tRNA nucleotidyltransferase [Phycisphaerales bacterium]|nr:CCA tRNA nucleotidyltransferase [Phycisphaerales bacterium]